MAPTDVGRLVEALGVEFDVDEQAVARAVRDRHELWNVAAGKRVAQYRPTPDRRYGLSGTIAPQWVLDLYNAYNAARD